MRRNANAPFLVAGVIVMIASAIAVYAIARSDGRSWADRVNVACATHGGTDRDLDTYDIVCRDGKVVRP